MCLAVNAYDYVLLLIFVISLFSANVHVISLGLSLGQEKCKMYALSSLQCEKNKMNPPLEYSTDIKSNNIMLNMSVKPVIPYVNIPAKY